MMISSIIQKALQYIQEHTRVYVADTGNHRIKILNNDLTVNQPPFGTEGDGEEQFKRPHDISFVEDGNIVTMCVLNNRIQVFTANNDIIQYSMTIRARVGGGVAQRTSIAADLQRAVYVSENGRDCVSKYSILMGILLGYLVLYYFVILMK